MTPLPAARLGYRVHVYAPERDNPTEQVCAAATHAAYDDLAALRAFAAACDVVTYEFENVPVVAAETIAATTPVRPGPNWLHVAQDRRREKAFVREAGADTAPYKTIETEADLGQNGLSFPGILKTAQSGYDGKGQLRVSDAADLASAWARLGKVPCVLEGLVPFEREISVIVARGLDGQVRCFPPVENRQPYFGRDHRPSADSRHGCRTGYRPGRTYCALRRPGRDDRDGDVRSGRWPGPGERIGPSSTQ